MLVDDVDVLQHPIEASAHAVHLVGLPACAVDRTGHHRYAVLHEGLERFVGAAVEIDAAPERDPDVAFVGGLQDRDEIGVDEHLAPVGQLDFLDPGVFVEEPPKVADRQQARADGGVDVAGRGRAGRTTQVARRACFDPQTGRPGQGRPRRAGHPSEPPIVMGFLLPTTLRRPRAPAILSPSILSRTGAADLYRPRSSDAWMDSSGMGHGPAKYAATVRMGVLMLSPAFEGERLGAEPPIP